MWQCTQTNNFCNHIYYEHTKENQSPHVSTVSRQKKKTSNVLITHSFLSRLQLKRIFIWFFVLDARVRWPFSIGLVLEQQRLFIERYLISKYHTTIDNDKQRWTKRQQQQHQHLFRTVCCNVMKSYSTGRSLCLSSYFKQKGKLCAIHIILGWSFWKCFCKTHKWTKQTIRINVYLQSNKTIGFYQCNFQSKRLNNVNEYCRLLTYQLISWAKLWHFLSMSLFYHSLWEREKEKKACLMVSYYHCLTKPTNPLILIIKCPFINKISFVLASLVKMMIKAPLIWLIA